MFQYGGSSGMMDSKSMMAGGMLGSNPLVPSHAYIPPLSQQPPHLANGAINPAYHACMYDGPRSLSAIF